MEFIIEYLKKVCDSTGDCMCHIRLYSDESGAILTGKGTELFSFYGEADLINKIAEL